MRPVKLTMSAFGSYAKETTISFDHLEEGLFLITGDTGSGKTLIFDAIMFALYDDTSGMTRGRDKLRSDFADAGVETFVELEFVLRGEEYTIRRSPSYERPKRRGQGMTTHAAEVEFTYPDGRVVTMIRAVEEEVKELLGLDKSQFRQVAMIAQGEFYELIGTSSSDRSEIFRRLFDTGLYERMQKLFADKWRDAKNEREKLEDRLFHELESIQLPEGEEDAIKRRKELLDAHLLWGVDDFSVELKRIEEEMKEDLRQLGRKKEDAQKKLRRAEIALEQIRKDNTIIDEYEKALAVREQFAASEEAFQRHKKRLEDDERARHMVDPAWNAWQTAKGTVVEERKKVEQSADDVKTVIMTKDEAAKRLTKAKENDSRREELPLKISRLNDELETLKTIAPIEDASEKAKIVLEQLESAHRQHVEESATLEKSIKDIEAELEALIDAEQNLRSAEQQSLAVENDSGQAMRTSRELSGLRAKINNLLEEREEFGKLRVRWENAERAAQTATDMLFRERAGYLASSLQEGDPCPVCGSTEHPKKAKLSEKAHDEATVERLVKEAEEQHKRLDRASVAMEKSIVDARSTLDRLAFTVDALTDKIRERSEAPFEPKMSDPQIDQDDELGMIEERLSHLKKRVVAASDFLLSEKAETDQVLLFTKERADRRKTLANELKTQQGAMADNTKKLRGLTDEMQSKRLEVTDLQGQLNVLKKKVSGRSLDELKEEHLNKSKLLLKLNAEIKEASEAERIASEQLTAAEAAHQANERSLKKAEETREDKEKDFLKALDDALFVSVNDYREKRLRDDERAALREHVAEEEDARKANELDVKRLSREAEGLKRQDVVAETEAVGSMRKEQADLDATHTDKTLRVRQFNERTSEVEKLYGRAVNLAKEEKMLEDIATLASGRHKEAEKISFETFVQTWYFSQVISRANQRFATMTNGRYELRRSDRGVDQRSRTGLDLSVEDLWTAKVRPVSTLSGGEKFQAALAMALGLSDVVSEHAGGVEVDALFIDEGFGGLDDDSLQDAIGVLKDLTVDDRLIGIISHVPMLKQAINQQLSVRIDSEGSSVEWTTY
ncbi:MAG TPA: SMC family ATPase [Clostridiaceae bacterium]|jgi:exonuclease SbcC|nr:SMC family ATPase [Clostridiaceae bacterium]